MAAVFYVAQSGPT